MRRSYIWGFILGTTLLAGCAIRTSATAAENVEPTEAGFQQWLAQYRKEVDTTGISEETLDSALNGIRLNHDVMKRDAFQPEFVKPIWGYLETAVSDLRVKNGRKKLQQHQNILNEVAERYQVAPQLITAIWGLETAYGITFGGFNVVEAMATLAYHGRRSTYGGTQLLAALEIIESGDIPAEQMQGSWAGGMGHTQFIPTSYQSRAVDYDGDGKRDIWNSLPDVFGSTGNFMRIAGWRQNETWGAPVTLPKNFNWALADRAVKKPVAEWAALGVKASDSGALPQSTGDAWILLPAGHRGPAFLALPNFRAIMRYNNSTAYALGISLLADRIAGAPKHHFNWPTELVALTRDQRMELQQLLTDQGFNTGGVDGILGANSRKALRAWQQKNGLVPDAFATVEQLELLRQG